MSAYIKEWTEAPSCCKTCRRAEISKHGDTVLLMCSRDIRIPIKKQSCAKHLQSFEKGGQSDR